MTKQDLVVIGNGMAGLRFLECLCSIDKDMFNITVIGEEPEPAYNRVLLSAVLAREVDREGVTLKPLNWYDEQGITLKTSVKVSRVESENNQLILSDNSRLPYDRLVIATGSNPILLPLPGADLGGVMTFRNFKDVAMMEAASKNKRTAVVIGGGLLGLETAYGLNKLGMDVTLLHLMDRLMERQLDAYSAQMLKEKIEAQGIDVILNADTDRLIGEENVRAVQLKTGEILPADLCIMAVGIRPNTVLADPAGLDCERGVLVNDQMQTSRRNIYAVGECAQHRGIAYGLVEPLYEQADILARHLTGDSQAAYTGSSISTNLKVSGVEVYSAGEYEDNPEYEPLIYKDNISGIYKKLLIKHDVDNQQVLVGAVLVGDRRDGPWYNELIRKKIPVQNMRDTLIFGQDISELAA